MFAPYRSLFLDPAWRSEHLHAPAKSASAPPRLSRSTTDLPDDSACSRQTHVPYGFRTTSGARSRRERMREVEDSLHASQTQIWTAFSRRTARPYILQPRDNTRDMRAPRDWPSKDISKDTETKKNDCWRR
ncbi:hypothetical protein CFRS1_v015282 [Colletotrichum fructicola]|nr:hypothetical protein CFRS1_v015282 [Colletotrichum fructicola]